jgi:hypothetical protein
VTWTPVEPPKAVDPAPFRGSGPFLAKAPPLWVPMRHFAAAAAAFWVFSAAFFLGSGRFLGFDYSALWVLGLTHTLTLGWLTMTIFGAMCQLSPVLWETSLYSPRAASWAFALFAGGVAGFVGTLWSGSTLYWIPACALVTAVLLYLYVFAGTMLTAQRLDWTGEHLALSVGYLALLVTLGFLLALDRHRGVIFQDPDGALIAHVHLALVGWVSLTIVGVSYRLVSMFALSHVESKTPGRLTLWLVNAGLLGLAVDALFFRRRLMPLWACLMAAGYLSYAAQMRKIFDARHRKIDPALAFTLLALCGGLVWVGLGVCLAFGWLPDTQEARLAYVFAALVGWATPFILGQIHKIVPFLVWLHVYSPRNWKPPVKVPKIQDLSSERLAWGELCLLAPAIVLGVAGFLLESSAALRGAGALLLSSATCYLINTGLTLAHLVRRDPQWTPPNA